MPAISPSEQPDLWTIVRSSRWSWPERYRAWRQTFQGRLVWAEFRRRAYRVLRERKRFGAKAIVEAIRWEWEMDKGRADFKVNNSFVSLMVDDLIAEDARFADMFERRRRRAT